MKNKTTAAFLSLFFGWLGVHQFYLRRPFIALLFIAVTMWFGLQTAAFIGVLNAILLFAMSEKSFNQRYNRRLASREERYQKRERPDYQRHTTQYRRKKETPQPDRRPTSRYRRKVTPATPQKKNPYKATGIQKYKEFDLEGAIEDFKQAIGINPNDVATHFNIACAYSLTEQPKEGYFHLAKAVSLGFNDFNKIKTHDDLAFLRIQPEWDQFVEDGFKLPQQIEAPKENLLDKDILLDQLNKLDTLKEKGLITEDEYLAEKKKLLKD